MPRRIAFLIFDDFQLLDAAGPISAFEIAARYAPGAYESRVIAPQAGAVNSSPVAAMNAHALGRARSVKRGGNERSFSSVSVANQGHVADVGSFVNLHGFTPSAGLGEMWRKAVAYPQSSVVCRGSGLRRIDDS